MAYEFVMVLTSHRILGEILLPYMIERRPNQSYYQLIEVLTPDKISDYPFNLTQTQQQLVKTTYEYSERTIHKLFCKEKNLKTFFETIDEKTLETLIRPYCEKRIYKCLKILQNETIKIFRKEKKYQIVHNEEEITLFSSELNPVFNFFLSAEEFKYSLSLGSCDGKILKLHNSSFHVLTHYPLSILIDRTLYLISDIDSKKIIPFFTKDFIVVPEKNVKKYLDTFVKGAIARYSVNAHGFDIEYENPEGKTLLYLENDLANRPAFSLAFKYERAEFRYKINEEPCYVYIKEEPRIIFKKISRNIIWENQQVEILKNLGLQHQEGSFFTISFSSNEISENIYEFFEWINSHANALKEKGILILPSPEYEKFYNGAIHLNIQLGEEIDWFDIKAIVNIEGFQIPFSKFKKNILSYIREYTLPDGRVVVLPTEWFFRYRDLFLFSIIDKEQIKIKKSNYQIIKWTNPELVRNIETRIEGLVPKVAVGDDFVPVSMKANLRSYQKVGLFWMYQLKMHHLGGCLADDMGLGKTIQTIALLLKVYEESQKDNNDNTFSNTSLIVMPVSLIHNWENEFLRFAPQLRLMKLIGSQRTKNIQDILNADIVLTSYGIVRNEVEMLREIPFKYIILDESQVIKNPESKIYKSILQLKSENKLVLTGTPVENSLIDLWAQLNFVNRNMLLGLSTFREEFVIPIERHHDTKKEEKLKQLIQPFILRRKKEEVLHELPTLSEQVVYCDMTEEQMEFYEREKSAIRNEILFSLEQKGFQKSSIMILKALNRLRLISNHPVMVDPSYTGDSGKYDEIIRSVENIIAENHKVLLFSSYVRHINLIANYLRNNQHSHVILTGSTINRSEVVAKFHVHNSTKVFLISLKAGGTGLNLTAADYVFILDPWWNPAAENQAISRAHRMGQDKNVFVYRFISSQSIEEKIILLQQKKKEIFNTFVNNNNPFKMLDEDDVYELFS